MAKDKQIKAKPRGWRFKGDNYKRPLVSERGDSDTYYEDRKNRSDKDLRKRLNEGGETENKEGIVTDYLSNLSDIDLIDIMAENFGIDIDVKMDPTEKFVDEIVYEGEVQNQEWFDNFRNEFISGLSDDEIEDIYEEISGEYRKGGKLKCGKRVSRNGNVYYEYRPEKCSPPKGHKKLIKGGMLAPNQMVITDDNGNRWFQSYNSIIVKIDNTGKVFLDKNYWDYSKTTGKYRNRFLGETMKETLQKIGDGTYTLVDLNENNAMGGTMGGGGRFDRGTRPSPRESATLYRVGERRYGQDGNLWEVAEDARGVRRWKKVGRFEEGGSLVVDTWQDELDNELSKAQGKIYFLLDISGSMMGSANMPMFNSINKYDGEVWLIDTGISHKINSKDFSIDKIQITGGGGTDFSEAFTELNKKKEAGENYTAVLFTDADVAWGTLPDNLIIVSPKESQKYLPTVDSGKNQKIIMMAHGGKIGSKSFWEILNTEVSFTDLFK